MSRIRLSGEGLPIPVSALPDPNLDSNFPPQAFLFTESGAFDKTDYENLGYTHYEVICIGAAGGSGGAELNQLLYDLDSVKQAVPQNIWDLVLERVSLEDYIEQSLLYNFYRPNGEWWAQDATPPVLNKYYTYGSGQDTNRRQSIVNSAQIRGVTLPSNWSGRAIDAENAVNPSHQLTFKTIKNVRLGGVLGLLGGAGGGGGRHVAAGLLADLDTLTAVVVGQEGADAVPGHTLQEGVMTPALTDPQFANAGGPYYHYDLDPPPPLGPYSANQRRIYEINNILTDYTVTYPLPHPSFSNPQKGGDGGGSSFGDDICQASGGEGGDPSYHWPGGVKTFLGLGGDGGSGGRIDPGGGAAGSTASGVPGSDGTWDGVVGKGGGGGLSGKSSAPTRSASHGGRGSYSFADPSVYGPRQQKSGLVPGGGGGALLTPGEYYGSDAPNSHPNGAVYLRLTKIA
jgi:hypothetical protein